jgi:chromosome segregation ATPase
LALKLEASRADASTVATERDEAARQALAVRDGFAAEKALHAKATAERDQARKKASELAAALEAERAAGAKAGLLHGQAQARVEELSGQLDAERAARAQVAAELADLKKAEAGHLEELAEERTRRDELLRDIAYIRGEVADLSTTKGALVNRLDSMTRREEKRRASTGEMTDLLRDAEVVASDRATSLRRMQARAESMEELAAQTQAKVAALEAELSEARVAKQVAQALKLECDALKTQIVFFQKQLGALQRQREVAARVPTVPMRPAVPADPHRELTEEHTLPAEWATEVTSPGDPDPSKR